MAEQTELKAIQQWCFGSGDALLGTAYHDLKDKSMLPKGITAERVEAFASHIRHGTNTALRVHDKKLVLNDIRKQDFEELKASLDTILESRKNFLKAGFDLDAPCADTDSTYAQIFTRAREMCTRLDEYLSRQNDGTDLPGKNGRGAA